MIVIRLYCALIKAAINYKMQGGSIPWGIEFHSNFLHFFIWECHMTPTSSQSRCLGAHQGSQSQCSGSRPGSKSRCSSFKPKDCHLEPHIAFNTVSLVFVSVHVLFISMMLAVFIHLNSVLVTCILDLLRTYELVLLVPSLPQVPQLIRLHGLGMEWCMSTEQQGEN